MRTTAVPLFLICGILVVNVMLAAFPVPAAAQENLVENGDFSQGLEHWIVAGPTNPCEPSNPSEPGGYYGCLMVTDEGTPGNPHLELWTGTGGEYGMERFEQGVFQTLSHLPKNSARITLSLRVWSLGNHSRVHLFMDRGSGENLTVEEMYAAQWDYYELLYTPSQEPTTITRDMTNFRDPTTYLFVGGDRVAIDDITIVAAQPLPESLFMQQTNLIRNGDFSQGLDHWECWDSWNASSCRMQISEKRSPGNTYLELHGSFESDVFQEVRLPEDATRVSLSIKAWGLTLPGQNPENVWPWIQVRITLSGAVFNGTGEQETYSFGKTALRMESASAIARELTGFKGKNITVTISGEEAAVDDVTVLATRSCLVFPTTIPSLIPVAGVILATVIGGFLGLRYVRKARAQQNRLHP